ncbi:hypothetical protein KAR91_06855 [Candidatus Pacearchaeota archaeon]|nr:hypothetical protein [Candidatus Pacearchaeota archaeon]
MPKCLCCGEPTKGGDFLPGHNWAYWQKNPDAKKVVRERPMTLGKIRNLLKEFLQATKPKIEIVNQRFDEQTKTRFTTLKYTAKGTIYIKYTYYDTARHNRVADFDLAFREGKGTLDLAHEHGMRPVYKEYFIIHLEVVK